jgi:predicted RNase H-like nuclease
MSAILGIDAAWTAHHPSGVALIRQTESGRWESVRVSCSYEGFLGYSPERKHKIVADNVPIAALLETARGFAQTDVRLIVADIPLAMGPIHGRRYADDKISKLFGGKGCSADSPSSIRPGLISEEIRDGFWRAGFSLATNRSNLSDHALIETYPHPALLSLMNASYRAPYKVGKSKKYWPYLGQKERLSKVRESLEKILAALSLVISGIDLVVPESPQGFSSLKSVEDKIDALVCAWIGIQVLEDKAMPIGDDEASIWLPADSLSSAWSKDRASYLASGPVASGEFMEEVEDLPVQERSPGESADKADSEAQSAKSIPQGLKPE